ncbi:hypothetical protein [Nocardiopsis sp. CNR-923]|uniref:hypothetical protein n=1 Tax=Nocardiopsis sp. CNR-923 TaxID=1904965 RepID=UPI00117D97C5|nr:hypothetical protein [Nocardiopsis sp. CNR-923]
MPNTEENPQYRMQIILEKLQKKGGDRDRIGSALQELVPLHLDLAHVPVAADELGQFKSDFSALLASGQNFTGLRAYVDLCASFAERGRLDGFESSCWMRSVIQVLDDEFMDWSEADSPRFKSLFVEDIEYIDETLEEVSDEAPPVRKDDIPDWVPESHWWWRAPKQQDMSEAERKARLEYDHLDGVYD